MEQRMKLGKKNSKYLFYFLVCGSLITINPIHDCYAANKKDTASASALEKKNNNDGNKEGWFNLLPENSITHHHLILNQKPIDYTAEAGTLLLRNKDGEPTAKMFFVSYTLNNPLKKDRPISFFFNGGPGAGSAYLNLGAAGPEVINFPDHNPADGVHAKQVPNPDSWLSFTDMVFIDAVDTGYSVSSVKPEEAAKEFYNTKKDAKTFAQAIQLWLSNHHRANTPIWLVGESYGGIRSVEVCKALLMDQNILINGIVMISPTIEMGYLDLTDNPLADAFIIPSYIAAHLENTHQLNTQKIDDAYHYALNDYLHFMINPPEKKQEAEAFYANLSNKTGLPITVIAQNRGVLDPSAHAIRSRNGKLYSVYDATLSIDDPFPEGIDNNDSPEPILAGFGRIYGSFFDRYAAQQLQFKSSMTYKLLNMHLNSKWDYKDHDFSIVRGTSDLRKLMALNPSMKLFIAHGYFDLVCPFATSKWIMEHMPVGRDRITLKLYKGGHMLYTRPDSRAALSHDVRLLYQEN